MGDGRRALVVRWRQSELEKKDLQVSNQGKAGFLQPKILINNKGIVIYNFFFKSSMLALNNYNYNYIK